MQRSSRSVMEINVRALREGERVEDTRQHDARHVEKEGDERIGRKQS